MHAKHYIKFVLYLYLNYSLFLESSGKGMRRGEYSRSSHEVGKRDDRKPTSLNPVHIPRSTDCICQQCGIETVILEWHR